MMIEVNIILIIQIIIIKASFNLYFNLPFTQHTSFEFLT